MAEKTFVYDNKRDRKTNELYLNSKGADVNFVLDVDTDHPEKAPAHKIILSLDSPVFDTMFFGSMQEQGDVPIVDASAAAFKEFLQFFYLDEVRLSSGNIVQVTNLCKKYEMTEFLKPCETAFQHSLTIDDICWGYDIAQLLEQPNLSKFCEERIKMYPGKIMKSESFLECDSKLLSKILNLISSDWGVLERVIACMEWSKAQCNRNNLDMSPTNFRGQLEDIFSQIPFDKLTTQQISQHIALYKGFFSAEELEELFQTSLPKQPNPFDLQLLQRDLLNIPQGIMLKCERSKIDGNRSSPLCSRSNSATTFSSNATLLLFEFSVYNVGLNYDYRILEGPESILFDKLIIEGHSKIPEIVLPKRVVISTGKFYRIYVTCRELNGLQYKINQLANEMQLEHGIKITFSPKYEDKTMTLFFVTPDR